MSYSHMGTPTLPSALMHFTSEFGMGSGGPTSLLSLDKKGQSRKLTCMDALTSTSFMDEGFFSTLYKYRFLCLIHTHVRDVHGCTNVDVVHR